MRKEVCWMCQGDKFIEESACAFCQKGLPHTNCDDSFTKKKKCPVCYDDNDNCSGKLARNKNPRPKAPVGVKL